MVEEAPLSQPSLPWRVGSTVIMGITGSLSRLFMLGANTTEVHGLDGFLELLDKRNEVRNRQRGLITGLSNPSIFIGEELNVDLYAVSNHVCVYVCNSPFSNLVLNPFLKI